MVRLFFIVFFLSLSIFLVGIDFADARLQPPSSIAIVIDSGGLAVSSVEVGKEYFLKDDFKANQDQEFLHIVQIKKDNVVVQLSWETGELKQNEKFNGKTSWIPNEEGVYEIEVFVWDNFESQNPLLYPTTLTIEINNH